MPSAQRLGIFLQPSCEHHGGRSSSPLPAPCQNGDGVREGPAIAAPCVYGRSAGQCLRSLVRRAVVTGTTG